MEATDIRAGLYTIVGNPARHSLSPDIYNFGFRYHGLNAKYVCSETADLKSTVDALRTLGFCGFNVTMPFKYEIIRHLDSTSQLAKLSESVNTVIIDRNGRLHGDMTDGQGFILALQSGGISLKGRYVEIVGAGGAGRALAVAALVNGAAGVCLVNRAGSNLEKAKLLARSLSSYLIFNKLMLKEISSIEDYAPSKESDILVNATSIGMPESESYSIIKDCADVRGKSAVVDLVYASGETELMRMAKREGCITIGGERQLLFQAAAAFKLYTGLDYPTDEYTNSKKRMIYLVGFMGCGKTTVAARLANRLKLKFADLDRRIESYANQTIAEIFRLKDEEGFRQIESQVLQELISEKGGDKIIVASGGGTVIQNDNYERMKESGIIIHLDISFGEVLKRISVNDATRPLAYSKSEEQLQLLFRSRYELYRERADYSLQVDGRSVESIVNEICGRLMEEYLI